MKKLLYLILILLLPGLMIYSQEVDPSIAMKVAVANFQKYNPEKNAVVSNIIPLGLKNDTLLYIVEFKDNGFVIISGFYSAPPVLGQCYTAKFDTIGIPSGLLYLIKKYKYELHGLKRDKIPATKEIKEKWDSVLKNESMQTKSYTLGSRLLETAWGQYDMYETEEHPVFCTGVAMAQILHYYSCRITGPSNYMWVNMSHYYEDANNALLIYDCSVKSERSCCPGSSTPGNARDAFVDYFDISSSAEVKWRFWHLSNWQDMLENELDAERPVLYSAGEIISFSGHSWVLEGYNESDQFYCNWGWSGYCDGWYSLGGFNPSGESYNDLESAIFYVYPNQPDGIGTPQLNSQTVPYNALGNAIIVPDVYGATSYEWQTQYGTITGTTRGGFLYSDFTTNVQVRAYNNRCQIYSPWDSEPITIDYPISGPTLLCSSGDQYSIPLPPNSSVYWTKGSNVELNSAQYSNPCNFYATNYGSSWIGAQVTTPHGTRSVSNHSIWAGTPSVTISGPTDGSVGNSYTYYEYPATYSNPTSFDWSLSPSYDGNNIYDYDYWANAAFYAPQEGYFQIGCTPTNSCGTGIMSTTYIQIYNYNYGYTISPNPASSEVTITVDRTKLSNNEISVDNYLYDISIFDMQGILKISKNYSGDKFIVPTYNLKNGTYIVKINNGKHVISKQLIIKH